MEFFVPLARVPASLVFPERLHGRVAFDASQGRLVYRGFMTKCTYDELSALSDDVEYHRALERLFVLTSAAANPEPPRRMSVGIVAAAMGAVAIALAAVWVSLGGSSSEQPNPEQDRVAVTDGAQ